MEKTIYFRIFRSRVFFGLKEVILRWVFVVEGRRGFRERVYGLVFKRRWVRDRVLVLLSKMRRFVV